MKSVVILGFSGVQALEAVGPYDVFTHAAQLTEGGYRVTIASITGEPATTVSGLTLASAAMPEPEAIDTLVLPGGAGVHAARSNPETMVGIKAASRRARRILAVCTGAFFAAQAGLLDGHRATTHWSEADRLSREFPTVIVDRDPIFLRSSPTVWTTASTAAGIAAALALVEMDFGTQVAQEVTQSLGLCRCRSGEQTRFAASVWMPRAKRDSVREAQEAIEAEPGATHTITAMAGRAAMSPRHFTRVFTAEVGETPSVYLERMRVEAARQQLEESTDAISTIAASCGFGSTETLRRTFIRRTGVSPAQYRKMFS